MGLTAGVTGQQWMLSPFSAPDPTFAFVGGPCCPTLYFVIAFWITIALYTLLTLIFCIEKLFINYVDLSRKLVS
jgi:hypothetical protein